MGKFTQKFGLFVCVIQDKKMYADEPEIQVGIQYSVKVLLPAHLHGKGGWGRGGVRNKGLHNLQLLSLFVYIFGRKNIRISFSKNRFVDFYPKII